MANSHHPLSCPSAETLAGTFVFGKAPKPGFVFSPGLRFFTTMSPSVFKSRLIAGKTKRFAKWSIVSGKRRLALQANEFASGG